MRGRRQLVRDGDMAIVSSGALFDVLRQYNLLSYQQFTEAMAELDHPNIVQFLDADKAGDAYYCAMEFVDGTDLGKVVRLQRSLPPGQASEYMRQTALGLQHAHENNLVHRDIKPVNLFLT